MSTGTFLVSDSHVCAIGDDFRGAHIFMEYVYADSHDDYDRCYFSFIKFLNDQGANYIFSFVESGQLAEDNWMDYYVTVDDIYVGAFHLATGFLLERMADDFIVFDGWK